MSDPLSDPNNLQFVAGDLSQDYTALAPGAPGAVSSENSGGEFIALDPRVVKLWRITHLIGTAVLLGLLLIPALIVTLNVSSALPWVLCSWLAVAALRFGLLIWIPPRSYRAWGYRIDDRVLETRNGIWWRAVHLLPLSRLQHVDLNRGPLERAHGLASLTLHTAGTHDAALVIPGLEADDAVRLRDRLVAVGGDDAV